MDSVQLIILGGAEIVVTIIAASIPILRALARDRAGRTGQHLALDATPSLSWTRRRSSRARSHDASDTAADPTVHPPNADESSTGDAAGGGAGEKTNNNAAPRRTWYGKNRTQQLKHLSQIAEADEAQTDHRDSGLGISPV